MTGLERIAAEIIRRPKDIKEIIAAGLRNMRYVDFFRRYADDDSERTSEDVTNDDRNEPSKVFFEQRRADALFDCYEKLSIRERLMIVDHLGFCPECHGILEMGKGENRGHLRILR